MYNTQVFKTTHGKTFFDAADRDVEQYELAPRRAREHNKAAWIDDLLALMLRFSYDLEVREFKFMKSHAVSS